MNIIRCATALGASIVSPPSSLRHTDAPHNHGPDLAATSSDSLGMGGVPPNTSRSRAMADS